MGKISMVSAKYIIHAEINVDGIVDRPDVIGAIFGQTEGLLGADLELRELQRSGRIGRIEVNLETRNGKTIGTITIPSSLDKAETCIVSAALEVIQRIGPCNAKIRVKEIEDVRVSKRKYVIERAKELLRELLDKMLPDSQELTDEVASAVRIMEIQEYGRDRLPAGPSIDDSDEIIVVEGRADVVNLVKHGFKNVIAMNGSSVPETIIELSRKKIVTAFVDGDRGGDLNLKELLSVAEIDYVAKAPSGREVEELTKKEIHKALRARISAEQYKMENNFKTENYNKKHSKERRERQNKIFMSDEEKKRFSEIANELIGTRGACLLDKDLNIFAKIPISELNSALKEVDDLYAVIIDSKITKDLVKACEKAKVKYLIGSELLVNNASTPIKLLTYDEL